MGDELLLDFHQPVQVAEGDLRFDHPELGQVAAGLGFFCAEGWAKAVDLAEGHDVRFVIQLARLAQVGFAFVEVFGFEQGGGAFNRRWCQDRGVHVNETV